MTEASPLRVIGVPEHFNLPWRQRHWMHATSNGELTRVAYREYSTGTGAMVAALNNGDADVAILLTEGAIYDIANGGQHRIVKVYVETPLEWGIHVAANGNLHSEADVRGKRYAISRFGSGSHLMATVHAAVQGWPADKLQFVRVNTLAEAREALPAGRADVFFWEKTMTHPYVEKGEFRRVGVFTSPWPSFVVSVSEQALRERAHEVQDVLSQIDQLSKNIVSNPNGPILISEHYGLHEEAARKWLAQTRWQHGFELPMASIQRVLDQLRILYPDDALVPRAEQLVSSLAATAELSGD